MFRKHGFSQNSRFYRIWQNMKRRCDYPNHPKYKYYGGRGIIVCLEWYEFDNFYNDMYESYLIHVNVEGERNTTLDRIKNSHNYEFGNCRWATYSLQQTNSSNTKDFIAEYIKPGPSFGYIEYGRNQNDFAKKYNLNSKMINKCLHNHNLHHQNWTFKYI